MAMLSTVKEETRQKNFMCVDVTKILLTNGLTDRRSTNNLA